MCACARVQSSGKLWGGRFTGATDPIFESFNCSLPFDQTLAQADCQGSRAYAQALARTQVITQQEADQLCTGLNAVAKEWADKKFQINTTTDEDIHTANERRLGELIGQHVTGKLHTGRSRNDQVATDLRLHQLQTIDALQVQLRTLIQTLAERASHETGHLMPGYTHLQPAQPVRWSHWLLSHAAALQRDSERLRDCRRRTSVLPLGSGALAGNPFGIDRQFLAQQLGFATISTNSLDAVCDRDFVVEFLFFASLLMTHISQLSEDLIIFSSKHFVQLSDAYSTGSSLMPQKKNPDACELLRGKVGRCTGALVSMLSVLKAMPRAYNKDLQEDKEGLFDVNRTLAACLPITTGVIATLIVKPANMQAALSGDMLATDLAEYLVRKGVPFRETHHVAGAAVKLAEDKQCKLTDLKLEDLAPLHPKFEADVTSVWNFETSVERRNAPGGTSLQTVVKQIEDIKQWLKDSQK